MLKKSDREMEGMRNVKNVPVPILETLVNL